MKFSWKWLQEVINIENIPLTTITEKLTLAGFEVEYIEDKPHLEDKTISLSITTNRADVCSIVGLAREINIILNLQSNQLSYNLQNINTNIEKIIKKNQNSSNFNLDFKSAVILDLQVSTIQLKQAPPSPVWLTNYLLGCDIETTDIISDIINYINIKWGQDIEIFDLSEIYNSIENENFITITNTKENRSDHHILIDIKDRRNLPYCEIVQYRDHIISILGLASNHKLTYQSTNLSGATILVVGQICKPEYIRQTLLQLNSKTDKMHKHLKGISLNDFHHAYNEALYLIVTLTNCCLRTYYRYNNCDINHSNTQVQVSKNTINKILSVYQNKERLPLNPITIEQIFQQLQFKYRHQNNYFIVTIPEQRQIDIKREIDIVEEIARVYGFEKFTDQLPLNYVKGYKPAKTQFISKIRQILRNLGLHEVIHYSLESYHNNYQKNNIKILNPLLEDQKVLKDCLLRNLIHSIAYNQKQQNISLQCFEIGKVFHISNDGNYTEAIHLAGIIGNSSFSRQSWSEQSYEMTWFQAKGIIEEFLEKLNAHIQWSHVNNDKIYTSTYYKMICHPYRTAALYNPKTKKSIGIFSQLNKRIQNELSRPYNYYIFEIELFELLQAINKNIHLNYNSTSYSLYPYVIRDISLEIPKKQNAEIIREKILSQNSPFIESVEIFNEYSKNTCNSSSTPKRYVGFRITYRSNRRTLNDKDIEKIDKEIRYLLKS